MIQVSASDANLVKAAENRLQNLMRHHLIFIIQFLFCLALGAVLSVMMGQDANFDLRNYHLYTPYSILAGNFDRDILPAGAQTTLNPTFDFFYVWLATGPLAFYPRVLAAVMGFWYGSLVFIVLHLASYLFKSFPLPERSFIIFLGTLTAVTGAATFSQIGMTFNDIPMGAMVLAGIYLVLKAFDRNADGPVLIRNKLFVGGVLFGLSAGFKLTGVLYAPAMCIALLAVVPLRISVEACVIFSVGWLAGFILPFSWWGWRLWARFGSPTFPFYNNIFRSRFIDPLPYIDQRFLCHTVSQCLAYPFYWASREQKNLVVEMAFRDPRMAIGYAAIIALAASILVMAVRCHVMRTQRKNDCNPSGLTDLQRTALIFLGCSYFFWLVAFSIIRYAVVIEVLAVLGTIIAIQPLARNLSVRYARQGAIALIVLACSVSLGITRYIKWERTDYGDKVYDIDMSWVQPNTLFVIIDRPLAYLAAFVGPEKKARFMDASIAFSQFAPLEKNIPIADARGISGQYDWMLGNQARDIIYTQQGPVQVLLTDDASYVLNLMPVIGLSVREETCKTIRSNLEIPSHKRILACDAIRIAARSNK